MAKKAKTKSKSKGSPSTAQAPSRSPEDDARERRYQAEDGLRTLTRAEEIKSDKGLMGHIAKHAQEQAEVAGRAARMVKGGSISDKQAAKARGKGAPC